MPRTEGSLVRSCGVLAVSRNMLRNRSNPAWGPDPELAEPSEKVQGGRIRPPLKDWMGRGGRERYDISFGLCFCVFRS